MKYKLLIFFAALILVRCHQPEIINIDFSEYYTLGEVDRGPITIDKNKKGSMGVFWGAVKKIRFENLIEKRNKLLGNEKYEYKVYIDEKGELDKIVIINGMGSKADEMIINNLKTLKYEPAIKDSKPVKFVMKYEYDGTDYLPYVEQMPEPIGGIQAISELVEYPEIAKRAGIEGRVFIRAFLNEQGKVDSVELLKGLGAGCDENAMTAIRKTKFKPAMDNGVPVKAQVVVPILFKLK